MKISIITINYNHLDGLRKTIQSVLDQSCKDYEFIIIDGGSTDGSADLIKEYDQLITYWVSEKDNGIYHAMNKGIDQAHGDYCLFLNSGDAFHDSEVLSHIFQEQVLDKDIIIGSIMRSPSGFVRKINKEKLPFVLLDFWFTNPIPHQSSFIKTSLCKEIRYDVSLKIASDLKFFLDAMIIRNCSYKVIDDIVADFEEGGISSVEDSSEECEKIFRDLLPEAIYKDYQRLSKRNYEMFFTELNIYRYSKLIYNISVFLIRVLSLFKINARFSKKYPFYRIR